MQYSRRHCLRGEPGKTMSENAFPDALAPGYRLHWYVLEQVLGQGGFGITYLARDTNLDRKRIIRAPANAWVRNKKAPFAGAYDFRAAPGGEAGRPLPPPVPRRRGGSFRSLVIYREDHDRYISALTIGVY